MLAEAEAEAEIAADWYEAQRPGLGKEFMVALVHVLDLLAEGPERYARLVSYPEYRSARLRRFPFAVVSSIQGDEVEVGAVSHGHRMPGYWLR